jgi:peptidoglycan/xylan/chitin deacetylase (PgdA/CDA1 family)
MTGKLPILLYHRIGPRDGSPLDAYTVSPEVFARQIESIAAWGWRTIPLDDVVSRGGFRDSPPHCLAITFDDGFAANRDHAWPILARQGMAAATFVVTERLGSVNCWDPPSWGRHPLLSAEDLTSAAAASMTFHSHGATHTDLRSLDENPDALRHELEDSRRRLATLVGRPGRLFSYPRGSWSLGLVARLRDAGYCGACTTMEGLNSARTNPYLLRRIPVREPDVGWRLWIKLQLGRDLTRWPPNRPPEISIAAAQLGWRRAAKREATRP